MTRTIAKRRQVNQDPHPELAEAVTITRFWRSVKMRSDDECWTWQGDTDRDGYGIFAYNGTRRPAHELALSFATGEQRSQSLDTCHSCDNPACCNPNHLRFDTRAANVRDMYDRGRSGAKLNNEAVRVIRERRALGARQKDLAEQYGVTAGYIGRIIYGEVWKNAPGPIQPPRPKIPKRRKKA